MSFFRCKKSGFSLIELMVVVSILTFLATMTMPSYVLFLIRAAKVEAITNSRQMATLANAYLAENSETPDIISYGTVNGVANCNANALGFAVTDCARIRYHYVFWGGLDVVNGIVYPRQSKYFAVVSSAIYLDGAYEYSTGMGPPTKHCRVPSLYASMGISYFFHDSWTMSQDGVIKIQSDQSDALENCFTGSSSPFGG